MNKTIERYQKREKDPALSIKAVDEALQNQLFWEQIEKLKEEEKRLGEENANLREKCGMQPRNSTPTNELEELHIQSMEVETELFIGPPERRSTKNPSIK
ncbi:putative mads box protein [Corchorus olitorius]|uniref:Mads box protein n=1 Tax=Corchorus olitorius TaxID=93759 RepID=A0A1R3IEJ2_9ROSI|nr:putative mads box protein [Corchorus olitorius]